MSNIRQAYEADGDGHLLVRSYAVTHPPNLDFGLQVQHAWDQLVHASRGVMSVHTSAGSWVVPPRRAIWIPAGESYRATMTGRVAIRTLFVRPELGRRRMPRGCRAVNVTPLVGELVLEICRRNSLRRDVPGDARLARVLIDLLETLPEVPLQLPMPGDGRARVAAQHLIEARGDSAAIDAAARAAGASRRTLERCFSADTGMTLGRWCQRLRLIEALRLLAQGRAVTEVALDVGYRSPSAFIAAFRQQLGTTPGDYVQKLHTMPVLPPRAG